MIYCICCICIRYFYHIVPTSLFVSINENFPLLWNLKKTVVLASLLQVVRVKLSETEFLWSLPSNRCKVWKSKKKKIRCTQKFSICPCAAVCTNYIWNKFPLNKAYKLKYSWDLDFTSLMLSYLAYDLAENMNRSKVYGFLFLSLFFFLHFIEKNLNCSTKST